MVPKKLRKFLKSLSDSEADKMWLWLDGNPDAIEEMVDVIVDNHENLRRNNDNDLSEKQLTEEQGHKHLRAILNKEDPLELL